MQQNSLSPAPRAYVVGCDTKSDVRVFSGITDHLAVQGAEDGLLAGMVNLYPRGIQAWGVFARAGWWKLKAEFSKRGGFKFTDGFLDAVWRHNLPALASRQAIENRPRKTRRR
jgi:hypothetical protein